MVVRENANGDGFTQKPGVKMGGWVEVTFEEQRHFKVERKQLVFEGFS